MGNLTLLGSAANVIIAEKPAKEAGDRRNRDLGIRFGEYARAGAPMAIVTTLFATLYLVFVRTRTAL